MVYEFTFKVAEEGADVVACLREAVDTLKHALSRWGDRCERANKDAQIPNPQFLTATYQMENCPTCETLHRTVDRCPRGCGAGAGYTPLNPAVAEAMAEQAIDARMAEAHAPDRETAITRALGAFWQEIETLYPQTMYHGIGAEAFNRLREAALAAARERLDAPAPRTFTGYGSDGFDINALPESATVINDEAATEGL